MRSVKILVCGSRNWSSRFYIAKLLDRCKQVYGDFTLIHGNCRGADKIAGDYAANTLELVTVAVPAKWAEQGRRAGPLRNTRMLKQGRPDLVLAFHNNVSTSKGTGDMVRQANEANVPVVIITTDKKTDEYFDILPEKPTGKAGAGIPAATRRV
jgi:hypothetical protein